MGHTTIRERSDPRSSRSFAFLASAIVALACVLRVFYVVDAKPLQPISGDINQYVLYAWNLNESHTFSSSLPSGAITPDSYRGPGYPLILAAAMRIAGDARLVLRESSNGRLELVADPPTWVTLVLLFQAVCGALTVLCALLIGRFWLGQRAVLVCGLLVALWPHLIVFTSTLLAETVFALVVLLGALLLVAAERSGRWGAAACSGAVFGLASLVNPIITAFPLIASFLLARRGARAAATALLLVAIVAPLTWSARNASLPSGAGTALLRMEQNFVQGSWPPFLLAFGTRFDNEISARIVAAEAEEERQFIAEPKDGLAAMGARMSQNPTYYLRWYLLEKPFLLWDWSVRIGHGDIYFLRTEHSPFEHLSALRGLRGVYAFLNPMFSVLGFFGALIALGGEVWRPRRMPFGLVVTAALFLYVTAVHTVLQGEPRYAVAYRAIECLLVATVCASVLAWIADFKAGCVGVALRGKMGSSAPVRRE